MSPWQPQDKSRKSYESFIRTFCSVFRRNNNNGKVWVKADSYQTKAVTASSKDSASALCMLSGVEHHVVWKQPLTSKHTPQHSICKFFKSKLLSHLFNIEHQENLCMWIRVSVNSSHVPTSLSQANTLKRKLNLQTRAMQFGINSPNKQLHNKILDWNSTSYRTIFHMNWWLGSYFST